MMHKSHHLEKLIIKLTNMAKKIPCKVIIHGRRREISGGEYGSKAEARRAMVHNLQPYTIVPKFTNNDK